MSICKELRRASMVSRTQGDTETRSQIICGMYGPRIAGDLSKCWVEPRGLREHTGLTPTLANKFINHSHVEINKFIAGNDSIKHMGDVGEWSQEGIDELVLSVCGGDII